jgi:hypothetical protein
MAWQPGTHRTSISLATGAVPTVVMSHDDQLRDLETDLVGQKRTVSPSPEQSCHSGFNFEFSGTLGISSAKYEPIYDWSGGPGMWNSAPTRWAFSAMSALFGGFGVFLLYVAFDDPTELLPALIFLGSAMTIVWSTQYSAKGSTDHQ